MVSMLLTPGPVQLVVYSGWHGESKVTVKNSQILHPDKEKYGSLFVLLRFSAENCNVERSDDPDALARARSCNACTFR